MRLRIHQRDAESYDIDDGSIEYTLEEAIEEEAYNVESMADSRHLEDPSEETRDAFRRAVEKAATRALQHPGDTYRDPLGTLWSLED